MKSVLVAFSVLVSNIFKSFLFDYYVKVIVILRMLRIISLYFTQLCN